MTIGGPAAQLVLELEGWRAPTEGLERLRHEYLSFLDELGSAAVRRDVGPAHVTASCFVFSADLQDTLLCFHRKGRFWVQTGGHVEPEDDSVAEAALREAREESGLVGLTLVPDLLDLDRHDLGAGFGTCRTHWDVGFAALADRSARPQVSAESEDVAWFAMDDLPAPSADRVASRAQRLRDTLRSR